MLTHTKRGKNTGVWQHMEKKLQFSHYAALELTLDFTQKCAWKWQTTGPSFLNQQTQYKSIFFKKIYKYIETTTVTYI